MEVQEALPDVAAAEEPSLAEEAGTVAALAVACEASWAIDTHGPSTTWVDASTCMHACMHAYIWICMTLYIYIYKYE